MSRRAVVCYVVLFSITACAIGLTGWAFSAIVRAGDALGTMRADALVSRVITTSALVSQPVRPAACIAPLFYTVCGDHDDYHNMAVGMLQSAYTWLDEARRANARFILYVGPRLMAARRAGVALAPAYIEYVEPDYATMTACGLDLHARRLDWSYVRIPVLPVLRNSSAATSCIVYADADEVIAQPLETVWRAFDMHGGVLDTYFYGKSEHVIGTSSNEFRAAWVWQAYSPELASTVATMPDMNSGNFVVHPHMRFTDTLVQRFCAIVKERRDTGTRVPLDQPTLSYVIGSQTPNAPYALLRTEVLDITVEAPTPDCQLPAAGLPITFEHFNWAFGSTDAKYPKVMCTLNLSLNAATATFDPAYSATRIPVQVLVPGVTLATYADGADALALVMPLVSIAAVLLLAVVARVLCLARQRFPAPPPVDDGTLLTAIEQEDTRADNSDTDNRSVPPSTEPNTV